MAPKATAISTVDEIDEAIWWVLMTAPRNIDYMKIVDALLDQRNDVKSGRRGPTERQSAHRQTPQDCPASDSTGSRRYT